MNAAGTWRSISLLAAAGTLAAGYALGGLGMGAIACLVIGAAGALGLLRPKIDFSQWLFIAFLSAATLGILIEMPELAMLLGLLAALAYWDLDAFQRRLGLVEPGEATSRLEKSHLGRLGLVLGLGLALGLAALFIRLNLTLCWGILLGLAIILGLRLGIGAAGR